MSAHRTPETRAHEGPREVPECEVVVDRGVRCERFKCYSIVDGKAVWTHMGLRAIERPDFPAQPVDKLSTDPASTRRAAVENHRASGALGRQAAQIVELMGDGQGRTRNEIARDSGIKLQAVCGRVAELLESGHLRLAVARPCNVSGVYAQELRLVDPLELAA